MGRQKASKIYKTKRMARATDQILAEDMKSQAAIDALRNQKFDEYLPGLGKHYCVPCARYYENDVALTSHQKSKIHKRQLKNIKFGPYTSEEASAGSGRDVEKHFNKQKELQDLLRLERTSALLSVVKGQKHKKASLRKGEMDIEEPNIAESASKESSPQLEISI